MTVDTGIKEISKDKESNNKNKICIVGTHPSTMMKAPFDNPDYAIWGLCGGYKYLPRFDIWFELHSPKRLAIGYAERWNEYFEFLEKNQHRLFIHPELKSMLPEAKIFPFEILMEKHGEYFTSTVAWLTAFAIEHKITELAVYGVHMEEQTEYEKQKPCVEHYLRFGQKAYGINVRIPEQSQLLKPQPMYGYHYSDIQYLFDCKKEEMTRALKDAQLKTISAAKAESFQEGVLDALNWAMTVIK